MGSHQPRIDAGDPPARRNEHHDEPQHRLEAVARFRCYGPEKPLFDKTWTLPDLERP
jgi:hypothetical protein